MSANQKKLIAVAVCVLFSLVVGFVAGVMLAALGAPVLTCVGSGAGACATSALIGVAVIALLDFTGGPSSP
ncbi:hypothetical protein ABZ348_30830 [Streptomyces sp. NPDC005963]|uniref:hypothetical protein n=1 Tax=Streptomyces sp. NPDC005963 TaxID=3156721 RepID=UPI0033DBAD31